MPVGVDHGRMLRNRHLAADGQNPSHPASGSAAVQSGWLRTEQRRPRHPTNGRKPRSPWWRPDPLAPPRSGSRWSDWGMIPRSPAPRTTRMTSLMATPPPVRALQPWDLRRSRFRSSRLLRTSRLFSAPQFRQQSLLLQRFLCRARRCCGASMITAQAWDGPARRLRALTQLTQGRSVGRQERTKTVFAASPFLRLLSKAPKALSMRYENGKRFSD